MSSKTGEQVKVALRRLPKYMTEKEVLEQVSPLPEEVVDTYFLPANFAFDHAAYATLILVFSEYSESLMDFERRFDGYIFVDSRGNDSAAVVEACANQSFSKCDRERMKEDTRVGAILTDKYFLEFCEKLEKEKSVPIMTLEQQIKKLNQPEDARTQIGRLETPLVKFFMDKELGRRRESENRRQRRETKRTEKQKNVLDILMKPSATSSTASPKREVPKEANRPMTDKEREKLEKIETRKKERNAIRKQKFLEEKKKKQEEREAENPRIPKETKKKERPGRAPRPAPAKTVGEQQGEDWIKKLTDPKAPIKKKHDIPVASEVKKPSDNRPGPTKRSTRPTLRPASSNVPKQRPSTAPKADC